jgi:two-component system, cell cycle response regulator DivK
MVPSAPTVSASSQLVLIVEDDQQTREMYAEWFVFSGFRVVQATNGVEAIEKARTLKPDVITTDIGLKGGMDGCQLTESLKSYARTNKIPVIAVTAWAIGGYVERARQAGCDAVLIKPCLPEALLAEIQRLLTTHPPKARTRK